MYIYIYIYNEAKISINLSVYRGTIYYMKTKIIYFV